MCGQFYPPEVREDVKKFVIAGRSYREIVEFFGVPKSTISTWFGKTLKQPVNREAMLKHLRNARKLAGVAIKNKWEAIREKENRSIARNIEKELLSYPLDNMGFYKSMLAMLYWAEGSKSEKTSGLRFTNTDPVLVSLYMTLLSSELRNPL